MRIHPGARLLLAGVSAVGVWAACSGGLKLNEGNAFPCDFREPEAQRDLQCPPSWQCGIDGLCHDGEAEQPGLDSPPEFQSERRFPRRLDGDTRFIAGDPFFAAADPQRAELVQAFVAGDQSGRNSLTIGPFSLPIFANTQVETLALLQGQLVVKEAASGPLKLYSLSSDLRTPPAARTVMEPPLLPPIRALRVPMPSFAGGQRPALAVVREDGKAGEVDLEQAVYKPFPAGFTVQTDGGVQPCASSGPMACATPDIPEDYKDARLITPLAMVLLSPGQDPSALETESVPVVVTPTRFLWRSQAPSTSQPLGQWQLLNASEVLSDTAEGGPPQSNWRMRHSAMGGVWAVARTLTIPRPPGSGGGGTTMQQDVLSTWTLLRSPARPREPRLERSWSDCSPCGTDRLVTFTPVSDGALGVEVLCESETAGTRALFRVTGASVVSPLDTCLRQPLTAPFDLSELASETDGTRVRTRPYAVDEARGGKLVLGGAHGQIWFGDLLSQLQPAFLDRPPVAVVPYQGVLLAFTRDFFAVGPFDRPDARLPRGEGLFVQPSRRPGEQSGPGLGNVVEGIPGWFLLETGQILRATFDTTAGVNLSNTYGPRLLGPSGETATGPYLGQGAPTQDGVSLVIAANDQLYYKELKLSELNPDPSRQTATLNPQLTPEPGFPVRSLARDGNVSLTASEGARVRGWVATSRSAFQFEQDAQTKAWSLTKLPLGDGEPVKVWTREAGKGGPGEKVSFGRLGLRDGQVLRLPQGLPITQPLPVENPRVMDYASLNGWPVALEERGIYRTIPSPDSEAGLMRWQPLALPAGLTVGDLKDARMAVVKQQEVEVLYLFTRTGFVYQLSK